MQICNVFRVGAQACPVLNLNLLHNSDQVCQAIKVSKITGLIHTENMYDIGALVLFIFRVKQENYAVHVARCIPSAWLFSERSLVNHDAIGPNFKQKFATINFNQAMIVNFDEDCSEFAIFIVISRSDHFFELPEVRVTND